MKKIFITLCLASAFFPAFAQIEKDKDIDPDFTIPAEEEFGNADQDFTQVPVEGSDTYPTLQHSVATNGFLSNWFFQAGFDWSAFYSDEEHGLGLSKSPFKSYRSTPALSFALGKNITPDFSLRLKMQGFWGKTVASASSEENKNSNLNLQLQPMFNLTNIFCGYKGTRVWNISAFLGAGVNYCDKAEVNAMSISFGLHSSWKVSSLCDVYAELGLLKSEHDADGKSLPKSEENRLWRNHDNNVYAEIGVNINLSKAGWRKSVDIDAVNMLHQAELDALNAQISDLKAENERMKKSLDKVQNKK